MPTAATVGLGSVAFLAWCSLFSCCSGYSAASAASAEFRLISRPNSSLQWQVEMCRPCLTQPLSSELSPLSQLTTAPLLTVALGRSRQSSRSALFAKGEKEQPRGNPALHRARSRAALPTTVSRQSSLFRGRRRRHRYRHDANCDGILEAHEAPKGIRSSRAHKPAPCVWFAEVRGELPVRLEGYSVVAAPSLEHSDQFVGLLGLNRHRRASTSRVDRHPSKPVELETMAAGDVMQRALSIFEVARLETQRRNHCRDVQMWHCLSGCVSEFDISHDDHPPLELPAPNRRRSSSGSHL
jgi:hypothetical protein